MAYPSPGTQARFGAPIGVRILQRASAADLDVLRSELHAPLEDGAPTRIKAVLQALTDEVRIDARDATQSNRSSVCPRFDHRQGQYRQRDSNPCYRRERAAS